VAVCAGDCVAYTCASRVFLECLHWALAYLTRCGTVSRQMRVSARAGALSVTM